MKWIWTNNARHTHKKWIENVTKCTCWWLTVYSYFGFCTKRFFRRYWCAIFDNISGKKLRNNNLEGELNTCTEQRTKQFDTVLSFLNSQGLDFIELNEEKYCKFLKGKNGRKEKIALKMNNYLNKELNGEKCAGIIDKIPILVWKTAHQTVVVDTRQVGERRRRVAWAETMDLWRNSLSLMEWKIRYIITMTN